MRDCPRCGSPMPEASTACPVCFHLVGPGSAAPAARRPRRITFARTGRTMETPVCEREAPPVYPTASGADDPYGASVTVEGLEGGADGPCNIIRLCAGLGLAGTFALGLLGLSLILALYREVQIPNHPRIESQFVAGLVLLGMIVLEMSLVPFLLLIFWRLYRLRRWACVVCLLFAGLVIPVVWSWLASIPSAVRMAGEMPWSYAVGMGLMVYALTLFGATVCGWKRLINRI